MTIQEMKDKFESIGTLRLAVWQTKGAGPSTTKIVYLNVGLVFAYGWLLMVVCFCSRYLFFGTADNTFALAIAGLSPVIVGFATSAHKAQNAAKAESAKLVQP